MLLTSLSPTLAEFAAATGWELKPEGACRDEMCVPLPADATVDGLVNLEAVCDRLGMGVARHDELVAVGPATLGGRALVSATAPDLQLPDFDGNDFQLSSLRGSKVVLVAWAPY